MKIRVFFIVNILIVNFLSYSQQADIEIRRINGQGNGGIVLELKTGMYDSILNSPQFFYANPVYQPEKGPVDIQIYNSQICPKGLFSIKFTGISDTSRWKLYSHTLDTTIIADSTIYSDYVQDIPQWGIIIKTKPVVNPGGDIYGQNGYLSSTIIYADSSRMWLDFVQDNDSYSSLNWIRSGHFMDYSNPEYDDWDMPDHSWDYYEKFETVLGGGWGPYLLCAAKSQDYGGLAYSIKSKQLNSFQVLPSIDLIITADTSKWSRSCVVEMCGDSILSQGNAKQFSIRNHPSVNINGDTSIGSTDPLINSNHISHVGMGWFPGYAINVETGERLNIVFGEDSYFVDENGRDMLWNPSNKIHNPLGHAIFGGKHFIYIMGAITIDTFDFPRYDGCKYIHDLITEEQSDSLKDYVFASTNWVSIPLSSGYNEWFSNDVKINIRVSKKYECFGNTESPHYIFSNVINSYIEHDEQMFSLFPNPVSSNLKIKVHDNYLGKDVNIQGYNLFGEQVINTEVFNIENRTELDVSFLKKGTYIIAIIADDQSFAQKIVIYK